VKTQKTVLIIGSGIAGPALAIHLQKNGFRPIMFEKIAVKADVGVALMLCPNGFRALNKIDATLSEQVLKGGCVVNTACNKQSNGAILSQSDYCSKHLARYSWPNAGIKRATLHQILNDAAIRHNIPIHYNKQLKNIIDNEDGGVIAEFCDGTQYEGGFIVGCDGLHSTTRSCLFGKESPTYTGLSQIIGLSPLESAPSDVASYMYGVDGFIISYACTQTQMSWAVSIREPEAPRTSDILTEHQIYEFKNSSKFSTWAEPVPRLLQTAKRMIKVGLYDRPPLSSWHKGRVVLLGDAAHPTSPHVGQGANQAWEDCVILVKFLKEHLCITTTTPDNYRTGLEKAFTDYEKIRIPRTTSMAQKARLQGGVRVCSDVRECERRDEELRHAFDDMDKLFSIIDLIYNVEL